MKIKIEECIPQECSALLHQKGDNTETVYQEGLQGAPDNEVWSASQKEQRFFITTDQPFQGDLSNFFLAARSLAVET